MTPKDELHIYEEDTNLFWGLLIILTTASATYILADAFISTGWQLSGLKQLLVLLLFTTSFVGIFKISDPLLHFIFTVRHRELNISVLKGEDRVKRIRITLADIEELKFSPHFPREQNEAEFDFSTSYHLMWRARSDASFRKLLNLESFAFILKVEDIAKIIRFIRRYNPDIDVPRRQADFFGL